MQTSNELIQELETYARKKGLDDFQVGYLKCLAELIKGTAEFEGMVKMRQTQSRVIEKAFDKKAGNKPTTAALPAS